MCAQVIALKEVQPAGGLTTDRRSWGGGPPETRVQTVQLRIQPNPGAGYRTYTRNTISSERVGDWRVELLSADGAVLHEERFTVR